MNGKVDLVSRVLDDNIIIAAAQFFSDVTIQ